MATLIVLKNSKVHGVNPTTLAPGELAVNIADANLYYGDPNSIAQPLIINNGRPGVPFPYTGSAIITGSLIVTGSITATQGITGSLFGTASYALTASYAPDTTFPYTGSALITGSLGITGSLSNGAEVTAAGNFSHAEGSGSIASGSYSHAEGNTTLASGQYSHAEGRFTTASGAYSHAEGNTTLALRTYSHAEGSLTTASGTGSHAEGLYTTASQNYSHAEGHGTAASGLYSHAEGSGSVASGSYAHAEGGGTVALGSWSHAEGLRTVASGTSQHVQGQYNLSSSVQSAFIHGNGTSDANRSNLIYAVGSTVQITGSLNVTQGITGSLFGTSSWADNATTASYILQAVSASFAVSASQAISSSFATTASYVNPLNQNVEITGSLAQGTDNRALGTYSHAQGSGSLASGSYSHAEGRLTTASGDYSHTEGNLTSATNTYAHAEGGTTVASGPNSHAEGQLTLASGTNAHAEGRLTTASGDGAHANGLGTVALGNYQHVQGLYNISSSTQGAFIVGNGTNSSTRSNLIFAAASQVQITGSLNVSQGITGSLFGTSSYASTSSYALTASYALNGGGGGGSGITSLNGLTGATQTLVTGSSGTNFNISSSGTVHTFNLPDASTTARGVVNTGGQTFTGTKTFINDIIVNSINIGAGPGNVNSNVRIGKGAGDSLSGGVYNVLIGAAAGDSYDGEGSVVIGTNSNPAFSTFTEAFTLNIGKPSDLFGAPIRPPQIWSPERISVDASTNTPILSMNVEFYSAAFVDYIIMDANDFVRAGTIKCLWNPDASVLKLTEEATDSIGDTSLYTFALKYSAGPNLINLVLQNEDARSRVYCNYTSRLLLKPNNN